MYFIAVFSSHAAFASGATLSITPQTGSYQAGQAFNARVIVDGGGQAFNAVKATVVTSPGLEVQSLTLGDCDLAFVKQPSQSDLSFAGAILGGSSSSCTVYTLNLVATKSGVGSITFLDSSVLSTHQAKEILNASENSAYSIHGTVTSLPSQPNNSIKPPQTGSTGVKLYTLSVKLDLPPDVLPNTVEVILDAQRPTEQQIWGGFTKDSLTYPIVFTHVTEGTHTITVLSNNIPISQQITQIGGLNGTIVFGISAKRSQNFTGIYSIIILCLLAVCGMGAFLFINNMRKKDSFATVPPES